MRRAAGIVAVVVVSGAPPDTIRPGRARGIRPVSPAGAGWTEIMCGLSQCSGQRARRPLITGLSSKNACFLAGTESSNCFRSEHLNGQQVRLTGSGSGPPKISSSRTTAAHTVDD